jgi:hypothetical protein
MNSKLVRQFGLKKGAATYKVENNLLKLYYYNDWFYKQPIASMDLPVEVDGIMYSANSISQGLKNIFKSSSNGGGDEAIVVDTEFNTESANPIANAPVAIAIDSLDNEIKLEVERAKKAEKTNTDAIEAEVGARQSVDEMLQSAIDAKADASALNDYALKSELNKKQDKGNYALQGDSYTKAESDERYMKKGDVPTDVYTKQETDTKLSNKLDATAYTPYDDVQIKQDIAKKADKSYVNTELAKKQDKGNYVDSQTYENQIAALQEQLNNAVQQLEELINQSGKIDDVKVNGKSVVADKIANIDMYTKTEIDNMIASVSFTVTRDKNTINIASNTSYVKDGTLVMNTSRAREENNTLHFS